MTEQPLKPCPNPECDGKDEVDVVPDIDGKGWVVGCSWCGMTGPPFRVRGDRIPSKVPHSVWNALPRRSDAEPLVDALAALLDRPGKSYWDAQQYESDREFAIATLTTYRNGKDT